MHIQARQPWRQDAASHLGEGPASGQACHFAWKLSKDPTTREWRIDAKPAPSRVDYSDSQQAQARPRRVFGLGLRLCVCEAIALFLERQSEAFGLRVESEAAKPLVEI